MDEITLKLDSPITEEQWDDITDVDFDHTDRIWFHTKHGKDVEFVKQRKGTWIHGRVLSRSFYRGNKIDFEYEDWHCSLCGYIADPIEVQKYKFCPGCGFPMVKGQEDDNSNLVNSNL